VERTFDLLLLNLDEGGIVDGYLLNDICKSRWVGIGFEL